MTLRRAFFSSKTKNRLILGTTAIIMIAILSVSIVLYSIATSALSHQTRETIRQQTEHTQRTLNMELADYERLLLSMRLNRSLHTLLKETEFSNYTDFSNHISEINTLTRAAASECAYVPQIKLYLNNQYPYEIPSSTVIRNINEIQSEEWYLDLIASSRSQLVWGTYTQKISDTVSRSMIYATIPIVDRDNGKLLAVVRLDQQIRWIVQSLAETIDLESGDIYILDADMNLIYGSIDNTVDNNIPQDICTAISQIDESIQVPAIIEKDDLTLFVTQDSKRSWNILYVTRSNLYMERNFQFVQKALVLLVVSILGSLVMVFVSSDIMTRRLLKLTASVKEVDDKALTINFSDTGNDEVSDLYQAFSKLLQKARDLIDKNQRVEQEKYALELQALQAQIAPHFLYNTLSSINAMALDIEAEDISQSILSLAEFYRLSLSNGARIVTLATEQELLEYYVDICRIRFGNKVSIHLDFDENLSAYKIPKMILQPFVENAIMHGLRESGSHICHITISSYTNQNNIYLRVDDDGIGITADQLLAMQSQPYDPNKHHAIQNIHRRIQLFYGKDYGVTISSEPGNGTSVLITLPMNDSTD